MIVALSNKGLWQAFKMAMERQFNKERHGKPGWVKSKSKPRSNLEFHFDGLRAEIAVASLLGADYDPPLLVGGDEWDFEIPDGRSIEVKYRDRRDFDFALKDDNPESFKADLGVLVVPVYEKMTTPALVDVVGWITREEFLEQCERVDYGYGGRLALHPSRLNPMESLIGPN